MDRNIHDIFDVILKIIITIWGTFFLNYIGVDEEVEEILNVEFVAFDGSKKYVDFLCLLKNGKLCHIEFQYPKAYPNNVRKFFKYNIIAEIRYGKTTDTVIFNFTDNDGEKDPVKIGNSKYFAPDYFYLGDVDFREYYKNINKKSKLNIQLNPFEEITLMLIPLYPKFQGNFDIIKKISEIVLKKELFDEKRFQFVQAVLELEIDNFLSEDEQKKILEGIDMTPQAQNVVVNAIKEVNRKVLSETKQEGIEQGIEEGIEKGRDDAMIEVAKNLKNSVGLEELSKVTGLTIEEIEKL